MTQNLAKIGTTLTETGYIGEDVESLPYRLLWSVKAVVVISKGGEGPIRAGGPTNAQCKVTCPTLHWAFDALGHSSFSPAGELDFNRTSELSRVATRSRSSSGRPQLRTLLSSE